MNKIKLGKYKHYSGKLVEVKYIAKHWDTHEDHVVYQYDDSNTLLITPLSKFLEKVNIDGQNKQAFVYMEL